MMAKQLQLSELMKTIRGELIKAEQRAKYENGGIMQFEECELEFALATELQGGGGVTVYVLDLKGGGKRSESNTIRIKFKAIPGQAVIAPVMPSQDQLEAGPKLIPQKRQ